jgi:type II secretory pathway pseudopilin PulG
MRLVMISIVLALCVVGSPVAQEATDAGRAKALDQLLDLYVRGGDVYYRAIRSEHAKLDGFVAQLATASIDKLPREEQLAFWLNAYNAIVLKTVSDNYPIQKRSQVYPAKSIRQIPGAFERTAHRLAGKSLTLDQIEQTILPPFNDPRVYFALGRGAVGSGRLRSEAFTGARLEEQLAEVASECVSRAQCITIDRTTGKVGASSIFSWRSKEFADAYGDKAPAAFTSRSPIERAVVAFVMPRLLATEKEFVEQNTFQIAYTPFDWTLNDLTGRGGR